MLHSIDFAPDNITRTVNVLPGLAGGNPLDYVNQYDIDFETWIDLPAGTYWISLMGDALVTGANIASGGNGFLHRRSATGEVFKRDEVGGALPFQLVEVPEPASLALWGLAAIAAVGLVGFRRRRGQQKA